MFGYKEGTEKLADCMKELYVKETQSLTSNTKAKRKIDPSVWDDLGKMSEDLLSGKSVSESLGGVSSSSSTRKITCFKTGEETGVGKTGGGGGGRGQPVLGLSSCLFLSVDAERQSLDPNTVLLTDARLFAALDTPTAQLLLPLPLPLALPPPIWGGFQFGCQGQSMVRCLLLMAVSRQNSQACFLPWGHRPVGRTAVSAATPSAAYVIFGVLL